MEADDERGALSHYAVYLQAAVVLGENLLAGRQPQSGALHLGGVKRLEYLFQSLRIDTRPGINNDYLRGRTHDF